MKLNLFAFPAVFTPDGEDGGFVITFRDLPEAITQGDTIEQCLSEASDCLGEAIAARIDDNLDIPLPTQIREGEYLIPVPLEIAWKGEIHYGLRKTGITISSLAGELDVDKNRVKRLLNPRCQVDLLLAKKALNAIYAGKYALALVRNQTNIHYQLSTINYYDGNRTFFNSRSENSLGAY